MSLQLFLKRYRSTEVISPAVFRQTFEIRDLGYCIDDAVTHVLYSFRKEYENVRVRSCVMWASVTSRRFSE